MANIRNRFVTSFSELYIGDTVAPQGITEAQVQEWFTAPTASTLVNVDSGTAQSFTITITGTATAAGTLTWTSTPAGGTASTVTVSVSDADTAAVVASEVATQFASATGVMTATANAGVVTVTYELAAGAATVTAGSGSVAGITRTIAVASAYDAVGHQVPAGGFIHVVDSIFSAATYRLYFKNTSSAEITLLDTEPQAIAETEGMSFMLARIPLVREIGTLANEATVIETPTFGERFRGKLRGQLDGGQLDSALYWAPENLMHKFIREHFAINGTSHGLGIRWTNAAGDGADEQLVVFNSFTSSFSIDTTFDDVSKANTTFVVDGNENYAAARTS